MTGPRIALVTGGGGDIGTAICRRIADDGWQVVSNYRDAEKARQWQQQQAADGYQFTILAADVSKLDDCSKLVATVEAEHGPLALLVNNAGITRDASFRKMSPQQWREVVQANLDSVFNMTRPVIEGMIKNGYGRIINISSVNGQRGMIGQTNYAAAKAGMHGFTMSLAQEVARKGITVNTISPGYIETRMVMAVAEPIRNKIVQTIPLGRFGKPQEVAAAVAYLASDEAAYITGADISINGGLHMS